MNKKETLSLWISVGAALFAAFLIFSYTQDKTKEISEKFGTQSSVLVVKEFINEMETIQEDMVEVIQVPEKFIQPGHVKQVEDVVGLVALAPLAKGEQILANKVLLPGPETGLSLQVSPGKRAITLPVGGARALANLLKPGDRIDILVALDITQGNSQKKYIKTLLQDVVILATDKRVVNELPRILEERGGKDYIRNMRKDESYSSVTVEATPEESQKLAYLLAQSPGSIFFTLRHPSDLSFVALRQATQG